MEKKLIAEINIEDKAIKHFASFSLKQAFNAHHYFELRFNNDQMGAPGLISLDETRDFVGKTLTASFGHNNMQLQNFAGLVTKVSLSQSHGYHGVVIVSGYSPTILIDRGPDLGSYLGKTLDEIVNLATSDTPVNDLKISSKATRSAPIDYIIQYRESDFEFLNRLSAEYHEWLYYDGETLNFGKPDEQREITLFYGRDVNDLQYAMEAAPIKNKRFSYSSMGNEMLFSESNGDVTGSQDLVHVIQASNSIYSKTFNQPSPIRVDNSQDIKAMVSNEEKANISDLLKINAIGDNAQLAIGAIADITMSLRKELSFTTNSIGQFLITSIDHHIDENGKYSNRFEGVVASSERLSVKNFRKPNPDMQLADVIDHNDPDGQGRIKVKLKWECKTNDVTEWLRVVSPNAGTGDRGANRGFFAIPEIGDQVMIAFEEGNVAKPVVIGSVYNSSNVDSRPQIQNHIKSLTTRSGHLIEFDDNEPTQGIKITDIHQNIIHIDTKGNNITITALENMSLNCKNMQINVQQNLDIQVGENKSVAVGQNLSSQIGANQQTSVVGNYTLNAANITEVAIDAFNSEATNMTKTAAGALSINSLEGSITSHAAKTIHNNSGEKSNLF
jgi:type VI secretion system secreted protein VgrG